MPRYQKSSPAVTDHDVRRLGINEWRDEMASQAEFFIDLHDPMPKELVFQRELLTARLA